MTGVSTPVLQASEETLRKQLKKIVGLVVEKHQELIVRLVEVILEI
ncbi:MAG: hypothetical protein ACFFB5_24400 [Promethearchaeota archaeon]